MSIKDFDDIKIPKDIDKAIEKGMKKFEDEECKNGRSKKKKYIGIAAAIAGIITLGISIPAIASKIPFMESVFEKLEEDENYEKYATQINQTVESRGVKVTISEAVSDGLNLYITYIIESEKPFSNEILEDAKEWHDGKQVLTNPEAEADFKSEELFSSLSLVGKFTDENTFIGIEMYELTHIKKKIPDEFMLTKNMDYFEFVVGEKTSKKLKGEWNFKVPVTVNKDLAKKIEINKEVTNYKVENMQISPFKIVIEIENKNEKYDTFIYDEYENELFINSSSESLIHAKAPKNESKSIRLVVRQVKNENFLGYSEKGIPSYGQPDYEEKPIMDIVIPIK